MSFSDRVIVALDKPTLEETEVLLKQLEGKITFYKVGFELFTAHGWKAVELVRKYGAKVFLDMKYHDIPNTVEKAIRVVCEHEVEMVNVHALGGLKMMKQVANVLKEYETAGKKRPMVIAVTILTSHSEEDLQKDLGIHIPLDEQVGNLAKMVDNAGLDGVVSSPRELSRLRKAHSDNFCIVTPGIRPLGSAKGDQTRVCTPKEAFEMGSNFIVIGRPITAAENPGKAADEILASLS